MKPNRQEFIYNNLLRAWQNEHKLRKLHTIKNKNCFLEDIRDLIHEIKTSMEAEKRSSIYNIHKKTIEMIRYMVSDLLDLRVEKILKATKSLKKIDENALFEMETQYYRQLLTAFRGYSKGKKMLVDGILTNGSLLVNKTSSSSNADFVSKSTEQPSKENLAHPPIRNNGPHPVKTGTEIKKPSETDIGSENLQESPVQLNDSESKSSSKNSSLITKTPATVVKEKERQNKIDPVNQTKVKTNYSPNSSKISHNFMILRILQHVDPLVGSDMKIYGPLEPGNIVFLPRINAEILIEEHFAVPISI